MTSPAADAERDALGGGDAASGLARASDGVELHYLRWGSGRSPSWAVIVFLHGIASHGGWFAETAADLDTVGIAVYAPDRRRSGRSGGPRGHLNRYERALDDVDEIMGLVSAEHPGTPRLVFLTEFDHPVTDPDGSALVDQVDAALGDQNSEYQTKRKSLRYGAPIIRVVRPGEFDRYRRRMVEQGHRTDASSRSSASPATPPSPPSSKPTGT
jgi:hypothetical protein